MKRSLAVVLAALMLMSALSLTAFAYPGYVVANDDVVMLYSSPVIDGVIEPRAWSDPAYFDEATTGHFWGGNDITSEAELYFAYDDAGLYFAADITDNDERSGFIVSTGYDDINPDGSSKPYGFNGDVMTLMLDMFGYFETRSYGHTPWYNVGIFEDNSVRVYRSWANEGDITSKCKTAGVITEDGWRFEIFIPWSEITNDAYTASNRSYSIDPTWLTEEDQYSKASVMYMDRMEDSTWGRYITVCERTYDGYNGCATNGVSPKSYGLYLVNGPAAHVHSFNDWVIVTPATCTTDGYRKRTCPGCGDVEEEVIPASGHGNFYTTTKNATCTEPGELVKYCGNCNALIGTSVIRALGHDNSDWTVNTPATATTHGLKSRTCARCGLIEQAIIPAGNTPTVTTDNYLVKIDGASNIDHIRYAAGILTTASEIRNAADCCNINTAVIAANTDGDTYIRDMPHGGVYSFWIRTKDGSTYIESVDISVMEQSLSANGVMLTVNDLYGVSDFFIAKGDYNSYREVADNSLVRVTSDKIGNRHSYTYTVAEPGIHTVCVRYKDNSRPDKILKIDLTVTEPQFTANGLQLHIANLDGVRVIRSAYGDYASSSAIKRADGCRNFTAKNVAQSGDPYTIQYVENGPVTVCVEYTNGYCVIYKFNVEKKIPTVRNKGITLTMTDLDDLYIIRYAEGEYTDGAAIKNARGAVTIRPEQINDGKLIIDDLKDGAKYTFLVQYNDNSKNIFTVNAKYIPDDEYVAEVGSERQLLLEDYTVDYDETTASLVYNYPKKSNSVFTFNNSYEATDAVYNNIVKMPDGTYRMYYKATASSGMRRICYIASTNGLTWYRPTSYVVTPDGTSLDNLYVLYDTNPACSAAQRFKAFYGQWGDALYMTTSSNGNSFFNGTTANWTRVLGSPASTGGCFYDTLNTVYWDAARGKYVAFVRGFHWNGNYSLTNEYVAGNASAVTRDIRFAESADLVNWTTPKPLEYSDGADWQMYANAIVPYFRAEQIYVGMPTRYRTVRGTATPQTDCFLMSSRDLLHWNRTEDAYLTPNGAGTTFEYGNSGYPAVGYIQTGANEMSFFMKEKGSSGSMVLYRYTLPLDGFRAAEGASAEDKLVTKYLKYSGSFLAVNYACGMGGSMTITATDIYGNSVTSAPLISTGADVNVDFGADGLSALSGDYVTLTFTLNNAKVYSYKFN